MLATQNHLDTAKAGSHTVEWSAVVANGISGKVVQEIWEQTRTIVIDQGHLIVAHQPVVSGSVKTCFSNQGRGLFLIFTYSLRVG